MEYVYDGRSSGLPFHCGECEVVSTSPLCPHDPSGGVPAGSKYKHPLITPLPNYRRVKGK